MCATSPSTLFAPCGLQGFELVMFDIFSYYASLGQVKYVEGKLIMKLRQFGHLARAVSFPHSMDLVEECFLMVRCVWVIGQPTHCEESG